MDSVNEWFAFEEGTVDKKTCAEIRRWASKRWKPSSRKIYEKMYEYMKPESIIDISTDITDEERKTDITPDYKPDSKLRVSDIAWCNDQWIYDIIWPYMERANDEAGWKYQIKAAESCQIIRYKKGGFCNFHADGRGDHLSAYHRPENKFLHGHVRKLSMSVILNDDFEGGAFEFASYAKEKCVITPIEASSGSVIVFPSSVEHRVSPVTKGTRYSLVTWFVGPPFV